MNLTDISNLKWSNIIGNKISYIRQKTNKRINVPITDNIRTILDYFRPHETPKTNAFIFPILNSNVHLTPSQIKDRIKKVYKRVNKE